MGGGGVTYSLKLILKLFELKPGLVGFQGLPHLCETLSTVHGFQVLQYVVLGSSSYKNVNGAERRVEAGE